VRACRAQSADTLAAADRHTSGLLCAGVDVAKIIVGRWEGFMPGPDRAGDLSAGPKA